MRSVFALLLLTGCVRPPSSEPPEDAAARRNYWRDRVAGVFSCRERTDVSAFLDRIRKLPPRLPESIGGGTYQVGFEAPVTDDLYTLDESFNLYLVWNGSRASGGIRSAEVVGFADLRSRFRPEHFEALEALQRCPSAMSYWSFDPVHLLRAVNAFLALGKEAIPALRSYVDLVRSLPLGEKRKYSLDEYRLFPVVQLLSTKPSPFRLGNPGVAEPGPATWPLFPLALEGDLPFMVVTGYQLEGKAEDILGRLGSGFSLRARLLVPGSDPIEAAETLLSSSCWQALLEAESGGIPRQDRQGAKRLKMLIRSQALEAVATAYRPQENASPPDCCEDPDDSAWRRVVAEVRALGLRWDARRQDFVRSR